MVELEKLLEHCNRLLDVDKFRDYAPNGLQIEGRKEVRKIVSGVTASQALIDAAVEVGADVLMVHHGFFWKNEPPSITGIKKRRIEALIKNDISLIAYHLPLDAHEALGNNAMLAKVLGIEVKGRFGRDARDELAMHGEFEKAMTIEEVLKLIEHALGRAPLHLVGEREKIKSIAWCSGAAQGYIEAAYALGVDAFISGEVSESTPHFARESGVHYFAAGHHATERYGVKALGEQCAELFGLAHEFIDIANPV